MRVGRLNPRPLLADTEAVRPPTRHLIPLIATVVALALPAIAAARDSNTAALQVALAARGLYGGTIDGILGPGTVEAVTVFQRRAGLAADGIPGRRTRAALGRYARWTLGSRPLGIGARGWDVAQLQFLLSWHGFPTSRFTGVFGSHTLAALQRFQRWARVPIDGIAGPATIAALRQPSPSAPLALALPLALPITDGFGPRGQRFHTGIDIPAKSRTPIAAAAPGRVVEAGWLAGGWGYAVIIDHGRNVRSLYAHLSDVAVRSGQRITSGSRIGAVGASGAATGPHLHFEVRLREAAVNPQTAFARGG